MNTLQWVCSRQWPWNAPYAGASLPSRSPSRPADPSFDDIATQFQAQEDEIRQLRTQLQQMTVELTAVRTRVTSLINNESRLTVELTNTRARVAELVTKDRNHISHIRGLENVNRKLGNVNASLQGAGAENARLHTTIRNERATNSRLQDSLTRENAAAASLRQNNMQLSQSNNELSRRYVAIETRHQEALFELEHLKCVEKVEIDRTEMPLVPQSFVVVLVDGDAYGWAATLFNDGHNAGALAATRLRNAVDHFVSRRPDISPGAKIIARVFVNEHGDVQRFRNFGRHLQKSMWLFKRHFTEALPLFDFFDCGQGKERADFKIKENFQLFLSNPYCHQVFLATCTDNGFARMIEPYRYHISKTKITLVSPGYVCREIETLGFNIVIWPDVFSKRTQPPEVRQIEAKRSGRQASEAAHNKRLGFDGSQAQWISALVRDLVPESEAWTTKIQNLGFQRSGNVGVRRPFRLMAKPINSLPTTSEHLERIENEHSID
ncbi:uncharacterized protein HMPREF1541_01351 [Cyphellophora europaea CBS 101466]|uniref:DUF7923 domain-containing protein n=1 Tax=Cyphellophora europaea (strain CBS 101466) TaxID=1220924 RepID=W2SEU8_CYPE1|nr:uncharacterized protein HMPREF1541_01351 [Cyphellophora europaea CBS 101466]ETN47160.1 hypothetical protein HMPREF1541_01351 [Cyphellophora europaea CBS 101466]